VTFTIAAKNVSQTGQFFIIGETVEGLDSNSFQEVNAIGGLGFVSNYSPPVNKRAEIQCQVVYTIIGAGNTFLEIKLTDQGAGGSNVILHRTFAVGAFSFPFSMQNDMVVSFDADGVGNDGELEILLRIRELPI